MIHSIFETAFSKTLKPWKKKDFIEMRRLQKPFESSAQLINEENISVLNSLYKLTAEMSQLMNMMWHNSWTLTASMNVNLFNSQQGEYQPIRTFCFSQVTLKMLKWIYSYRKEKLGQHSTTVLLFPRLLWLWYDILVMAKLLSHNFKMPAWPFSDYSCSQ